MLVALATLHEAQLWLALPADELWVGRLSVCVGVPGLLTIGAVAYRNWRAPTLETAFVFNGLLVGWLLTIAFPFLVEVRG